MVQRNPSVVLALGGLLNLADDPRVFMALNPIPCPRRSLKTTPKSDMPAWQGRLFIWLAGRAADATEYFKIPNERVVEVGTQVLV